jgi:hypothetical protein
MMAEREKMMTDMKAADQRLDARHHDEHRLRHGEDGGDRRRRHRNGDAATDDAECMVKMHEGMMSHMMEHMQAGTASMAMCPMRKQMGGTKP